METFRQDVRYALRVLRSRPLVTVLAVLCLGIGIGASTAIFAPIDVFMIRPLPYPRADRLLTVSITNAERGWTDVPTSIPDFLDYRASTKTADLAGYYNQSFNASGGTMPAERLDGVAVSSNFFRVMGVPPSIGRSFLPDEEAPGHSSAIISYDLWMRRFGGDSTVLGSSLRLDGTPYTIVGVMPRSFDAPDRATQLWTPLNVTGKEARAWHYVRMIGRARGSASIDAVRSDVAGIARGLATRYPDADAGNGTAVISLHDTIFNEHFRVASTIAGLAVTLLLLIAITNVMNLLLAQVSGREREIAIRTAIGAGRWRIIRQLLTESVILGLLGGALGIALTFPMVSGLVALMPSNFPRVDQITVDGRVVAYAIAVTLVTGVVTGLAPALRLGRRDLRGALQDGGRGTVLTRGGARLRNMLVVSQVSLALILLVASGLLVKGFRTLQTTDLGFDMEHVLTARAALATSKYPDDDAIRRYTQDILERVSAIPGVTDAGVTNYLPSTSNSAMYYQVEGQPVEEGRRPVVSFRNISADYFRTLGMSIRTGRGITAQDRDGAPRVVVVNQRFAERHWPNSSPIGKHLIVQSGEWEIVGVVGDAFELGPDTRAPAVVYFPFEQAPTRYLGLAVRTTGEPGAVAPAVRAAAMSLDADQPLYDVVSLGNRIANDSQRNGVLAEIMAVLACIAFVLAVIGVYGVMAYAVGQRTQEIGIRMAIGAEGIDVERMVVRQGGMIVALGTVVGLVLAALVSKGLSLFLFGVSAFDPTIFAGMTMALVVTGVAACYVPARRAARVDPLIALRAE